MKSGLDLEAIRVAAKGKGTDQVPVTKRFLRRMLRELEASGATFRSPIVVLPDKREGKPA